MKVKVKVFLDGGLYKVVSWELVKDTYTPLADEANLNIEDVPQTFYMDHDKYHLDTGVLVQIPATTLDQRVIDPGDLNTDYTPAVYRANTFGGIEVI